MYFVKFSKVYLVYVYVREKSCNETHFDWFNIVWQVFPRFYVAFIIQRLLYRIYCVLEKNWKCRKCQKDYCMVKQVLGGDKGS